MALPPLTSNSISQVQTLFQNTTSPPPMYSIAGKLYIAIKRQITLLAADGHICIYASDTSGLTWTLVVNGGNGTDSFYDVCSDGAKIYILDTVTSTSPNFNLGVWIFNPVGNTLTQSANGPASNNDTNTLRVSVLNNGKLLCTYTKSLGGGFGELDSVIYDPLLDSWSAATTLSADGSQAVAQVHDPATDKTFIFYQKSGTQNLQSFAVDASITILNTSGVIFTFGLFRFNHTWGCPCISSNLASGQPTVCLPFINGFQSASMVYENIGTYATSVELVEDSSGLPSPYVLQSYSQSIFPGLAAFDLGGTLYLCFIADNGELNNASSIYRVYVKDRSAGGWGNLNQLYQSPVSREGIQPYVNVGFGGTLAIQFDAWDPTDNMTSGSLTSLTSFILLPAVPTIHGTRFGVKTFLAVQPANQTPYRLCVNNNRLYCVLPDNTGIFSCFVYYLGRENNQGGYWYRYVVDPAYLFSEEDGMLYGGFGDGGVGNLFTLDVANVLQFAGTNINIDILFPFSKNEINQRKDVYHLRFHIDTGGSALALTGYTDESGKVSNFSLGNITAAGMQELDILIQNTSFNLKRRMTLELNGTCQYFKLLDWSIDYDNRPEPVSFLRIATNYQLAAKKRLRTVPIVIDTRGQNVTINVIADGVSLGNQTFNTNERITVFYYMSTDVFATDLIINITAVTGNVFEFYDAPPPVNVEVLPVGKLFDQIGPVEFERNGELYEFRVRMLATTNTITYNVYMDDVLSVSAQPLPVTVNVDKTYGPIKLPKGIRGSVCRIEFLSSNGVFYRWNCKLKYYVGGVKSDTKQITVQDKSIGLQS